MRKAAISLAILCTATRLHAQTPYERFGLDTTAAIDFFRGDNVNDRPQIVVDITATAQLGNGWQAYFRPWFRLPRPTTAAAPALPWDAQIYQASLRYERTGPVSTRVDVGYMPSPVGLGIFDVNPRQNPTIAGHASYFTPLLPFDTGSARPSAMAATYPLAAVFTASTTHWDARAALVNSAPVRISVAGVTANPRATPVFEAGAGVTPIAGLRVGTSFAHGDYLASSEVIGLAPGDRTLTLAGLEAEYAVRYTKFSGEFIHDTFTAPGGNVGATEWFIEGTQTLTPRWAVAGRHEGTSATAVGTGVRIFGGQPRMLTNELTAVFRVNRDVMLKASYYTRQPYAAVPTGWDQQFAVQAVFQRRWW